MIITRRFVLINFPKTGSTFARQVVAALYAARRNKQTLVQKIIGTLRTKECMELYLPNTEFKNADGSPDQHGRYEQVPSHYKKLPVLSVVRDPVIRNISLYEFGWWKQHPVAPVAELKRHFPAWPDLDFETFMQHQCFNTGFRNTGVTLDDSIGNQTVQFIQYFFRDPAQAFRKLSDDYIYSGEYRRDMPNLTLLRSEHLNNELHSWLLACGFTPEELEFINRKEPVRPDGTVRLSDDERMGYLADETVRMIHHRERYLYRIYADFGIHYRNHS